MARQNKQPQETRKVNRNSVKIKELQKTKTVEDIGKRNYIYKKVPAGRPKNYQRFLSGHVSCML